MILAHNVRATVDVSCVRLKSVHHCFVKTPPAHRTPAVHSAQVYIDNHLSSESFLDLKTYGVNIECFDMYTVVVVPLLSSLEREPAVLYFNCKT